MYTRANQNTVCRCFSLTICVSLILSPASSYAQAINLPVPGTMVMQSQSFIPAIIKGMTIHPENPLNFDFFVDKGNTNLEEEAFNKESLKLIKYFLAALTVPEKNLWVNLSPYEKDRMISKDFGATEMGRDLLAQDYILKQLTASMMYPENELGQKFWERIYKQAWEKYGTTDVPVNTFNKVWIVPEKADVYQKDSSAFVISSRLKVMMEEDYVALATATSNRSQDSEASITSKIIREIIVPAIEKEVNEGQSFAQLRQVYNSVILAWWFKQTLKESLLGKIYVDRSKTRGVEQQDIKDNEKIYEQYVESFKKGVYNYIKEEYDPATQDIIQKKYISGGTNFDLAMAGKVHTILPLEPSGMGDNGLTKLNVDLLEANNKTEIFKESAFLGNAKFEDSGIENGSRNFRFPNNVTITLVEVSNRTYVYFSDHNGKILTDTRHHLIYPYSILHLEPQKIFERVLGEIKSKNIKGDNKLVRLSSGLILETKNYNGTQEKIVELRTTNDGEIGQINFSGDLFQSDVNQIVLDIFSQELGKKLSSDKAMSAQDEKEIEEFLEDEIENLDQNLLRKIDKFLTKVAILDSQKQFKTEKAAPFLSMAVKDQVIHITDSVLFTETLLNSSIDAVQMLMRTSEGTENLEKLIDKAKEDPIFTEEILGNIFNEQIMQVFYGRIMSKNNGKLIRETFQSNMPLALFAMFNIEIERLNGNKFFDNSYQYLEAIVKNIEIERVPNFLMKLTILSKQENLQNKRLADLIDFHAFKSKLKQEGSLERTLNNLELSIKNNFDKAMAVQKKYGGINLDPNLLELKIKRDGNGIPLPLEQQPVMELNIEGFIPIIINITPAPSLPVLLGLVDEPQKENKKLGFNSNFDPSDKKIMRKEI